MQVFELLAEEESGAEIRIREGRHPMVKELESVIARPDVDVATLSAHFIRLPQRYADVAGDVAQEEKFSNALKGWANKKFLGGSDRNVNVNLTEFSQAILNAKSTTAPAASTNSNASTDRAAQAQQAINTVLSN